MGSMTKKSHFWDASMFKDWLFWHHTKYENLFTILRDELILIKISSLAVPTIVKMTTFSAPSDKNYFKMTTCSFQCGHNQNIPNHGRRSGVGPRWSLPSRWKGVGPPWASAGNVWWGPWYWPWLCASGWPAFLPPPLASGDAFRTPSCGGWGGAASAWWVSSRTWYRLKGVKPSTEVNRFTEDQAFFHLWIWCTTNHNAHLKVDASRSHHCVLYRANLHTMETCTLTH